MTVAMFVAALALPVVERPARTASSPYFALLLTGDGGWRRIDASLADELNARGVSVVGLLSNRYFATVRLPSEIARDVAALIDRYESRWRKKGVIVIGYSRGADAIPIALAHMNDAERGRVVLAAMLGPAMTAELGVHHWWTLGPSPPRMPLLPLVQSMRDVKLLCVSGTEETESLCRALHRPNAAVVQLPGGHHFGGRYRLLARAILAAVVPP